ncbi:isoprenylcysteine carboxyl methyltransferase family protein [Metabacillus sp. RGM 3146]|uniref:isoprenylcysteine carboxyl methyltransferase family protein n=1 Tax=Metabacillus sp. RGM 3146 TaxID=3401092 RepID=UPI003B9A6A1C
MFWIFITLLIVQRVSEAAVAKNNEKIMKKQGAKEYGKVHYPFIVGMHVLFFFSFLAEVLFLERDLSPVWYLILPFILMAQLLRYWALASLGTCWNTKILMLPNLKVVTKGPYKYIRHPNYLVVAMEFVLLPLLFQAYFTAILFSILNACLMGIRIPEEEAALLENSMDKEKYAITERFLPKRQNDH